MTTAPPTPLQDRSSVSDQLRSGISWLLGGRFINAGEGLQGTSSLATDVTLAMVPATADSLGGVKIGDGITVSDDGTVSGDFGDMIQVNLVGVSDDPDITVNAAPFFTVNGAAWPQ